MTHNYQPVLMVVGDLNLKIRSNFLLPVRILVCFIFLSTNLLFAQSVNNDCINARAIVIPSGGFAYGINSSTTDDLSLDNTQVGETFAPAILVASQNKKSMWYKFSLPTTRSVRVTLSQPGTLIANGDAGFAVYKTDSCLPVNAQLSTKLTPLGQFGWTYHPCVDPGDYLIQVSGKNSANGPLFIQLEISDSTNGAYDHPVDAYNFATVTSFFKSIDFLVDCHSIEDASEYCSILPNASEYTKSTWHTFTTPAAFDYMMVALASPTGCCLTGKTFGYNLYQGDCKSSPIASLTLVDGCDSIKTNGFYPAIKSYKCSSLLPNTTYSIQLLYHKNFSGDIRLAVSEVGNGITQGPQPATGAVGPGNVLGVLAHNPLGLVTNVTDVLGCNSRHSLTACGTAIPASGISFNSTNYNLSTFFTFTLATSSNIDINTTSTCHALLLRLFDQGVSALCSAFDTTAHILAQSENSLSVNCLPPGNYTLQLSGTSDSIYNNITYQTIYYGYGYQNCYFNNLGKIATVRFIVQDMIANNHFSLSAAGAFDSLNTSAGTLQPLLNGIMYQAVPDTFGCQNTVLPAGNHCSSLSNKAMYREFVIGDANSDGVPDSGIVSLNYGSSEWSVLYRGDAESLANAQSVYTYPDSIMGLITYSRCETPSTAAIHKTCVIPGTYTLVTYGTSNSVGNRDIPTMRFDIVNTKHYDGATAQNLGSIIDTMNLYGTTSITSDVDYFSCRDNAVVINGFQPCSIYGHPAGKAIYREFFLSNAASVHINVNNVLGYFGNIVLFSGRASSGLSGLNAISGSWGGCGSSINSPYCPSLPAGWYTVVSYGDGPTYSSPLQNQHELYYYGFYNGSYIGVRNLFTISVTLACKGPRYNRPYKACVDSSTLNPFLIQWAPRVGSTPAYPVTDTIYTLYTEHFDCTVDTPFSAHPVIACNPSNNRVTYYVFQLIQESFVQINTQGYWGKVFAKDVRFDSLLLPSAIPVQPCLSSYGFIELCRLQPGTYTLVIFAGDNNSCGSVTPTVYIDQVGFSRFDHANKAYDFGIVVPDSAYHNGKTGDVNPLNALRAPSNDFFYCTTGSQQNDPPYSACYAYYNPEIYSGTINNDLYNASHLPNNMNEMSRRNLWYTFVIDRPGFVHVRVSNMTTDKPYQYPFAIYKSDVNGALSFSSVVSTGQVDSTLTQGLSHIKNNIWWPYYCQAYNEISFYREACSPSTTDRYYIVVDNRNLTTAHLMDPNHQVEVSIMLDSITPVPVLFDHYFEASNFGTLGAGTYSGATDNYSCATADANDPVYIYSSCASKTLWYKFTTNVTGHLYYRIKTDGIIQDFNPNGKMDIQLFRQVLAGDSTSAGLAFQNGALWYNNIEGKYWGMSCVSPGTYYLLLPGCSRLNEFVFPEIRLTDDSGDFCYAPRLATLAGPGSSISSVVIDCHTIGTDYGEFAPILTCPNGAATNKYKSSWFKIDITGTDTLDVTAFLVENTSVNPSDIKYRMMTGNCGAMQEQSCVQDANTQNTYQCLIPGSSYYIQVFTPVVHPTYGTQTTGNIDLHLNAVLHADSCSPPPACLANSNFIPVFDCNTGDSVRFLNYSTYGSCIQYKWDFGYAGKTSTAVSPTFFYPALATNQTYNVKLVVVNTCSVNCRDSVTIPITIPGRPYFNLGNDTSLCKSGPLLLRATTFAGATYLWQNGTSDSVLNVTVSGKYFVSVTYNGCTRKDTINIYINPISTRAVQQFVLCGNDSVLLNDYRGYGETFAWSNGKTTSSIYTKLPGTYWVDLTLKGCTIRDSFIVSSVSGIHPLGNDTAVCIALQPFVLNASTPGATSYSWQNGSTNSQFNATTTGIYWVIIRFGSCSLRDSITLTKQPTVSTNLTAHICSGLTYRLPSGRIISSTGIYRDTLRYVSGCDSVLTIVNLIVDPNSASTTNVNVCSNTLPYSWNGNNYGSAGSYTVHKINAAGCDSAVTLNLFVKQTSSSVSNISACSNMLPLAWNGNNYNSAGTYLVHLVNAAGCDSAATLNLAVNQTSSSVSSTSVCSNSLPYLWNGGNYNSSGSYSVHLLNAKGCDSIATLSLTVKQISSSASNLSVCSDALPFTWNGNNYNSSGTYTVHLVNSEGCDSAATLNLAVKQTTSSVSNLSVCSDSLPFAWNGNSYNITGSYIVHLINRVGCDSAATLNLALKQTSTSVSNASVCSDMLPFIWNGNNYTATGSYTVHLVNAAGCDSAAQLNLVVLQTTSSISNETVCSNLLPFVWNGNNYNASGSFTIHLVNVQGCDSIATLSLAVKQISSSVSNLSVCSDSLPFIWNGNNYNSSGSYTVHFVNAEGCDSAAILNLTVNQMSSSVSNFSVCSNSLPFIWNGNTYSITGSYIVHLINTVGCDSAATLNLTIKQTTSSVSTASMCSDMLPFIWNGNSYTATGSYTVHLVNAAGCDSAAQLNLVVLQTTSSVSNVTICSNLLPFTWNGNNYNSTGAYLIHLVNADGCDSAATLNLTVNTIVGFATADICIGQTYTLHSGQVVTTMGTYQDTLISAMGCDSIVSIQLNVYPIPYISLGNDTTICEGTSIHLVPVPGTYNYIWYDGSTLPDHVVASAGTYWVESESHNCFATDSVRIGVKPLPVVQFSVSKDSVCVPECISIMNTSQNLEFWTWQFSGPVLFSSSSVNPSQLCFQSPGSEQLMLNAGNTCMIDSVINIVAIGEPQQLNLPDTLIRSGFSVLLNAGSGSAYLWSPSYGLSCMDCQTPYASPLVNTTYIVEVVDPYGCNSSVLANVLVIENQITVYIPKAFTPNGDNNNEMFKPYGVEIKNYKMTILNRWGNKIFEEEGVAPEWDGTYLNNSCEQGIYEYILEVSDLLGRKSFLKGSVILLR